MRTGTKIIMLNYFLYGIEANVSVVIEQCFTIPMSSVAGAHKLKLYDLMFNLLYYQGTQYCRKVYGHHNLTFGICFRLSNYRRLNFVVWVGSEADNYRFCAVFWKRCRLYKWWLLRFGYQSSDFNRYQLLIA